MTRGTDDHAATLLEVSDLDAGYADGELVISGLEFKLSAGQTIALLGPNGGGKTTLLRALLGEAPYRRGRVEVTGNIAYVPQTERTRLDFPVSALDVAVMGTYANTPWFRWIGREQRAIAGEALARVGLAEYASSRFGELSGGQRQRVLIARALAQEARILLLDEPLSGVDQPSSEQILAILADLRSAGHGVIVSTHDINQARAFDAVLCVNGIQVAFGAPQSLTPEVLAETYGAELVVLDGGERAVVVQHHHH